MALADVENRNQLVKINQLLASYLAEDIAALRAAYPLVYADPDFIKNLLDDGETIRNAPIPESRITARKAARLAMKVLIDRDLRPAVTRLEQYVARSFPAYEFPSQWADTSVPAYIQAVRGYNWASTENMLVGMTTYIAANKQRLAEVGSMPDGFQDELLRMKSDFQREYDVFEEEIVVATDATAGLHDLMRALKAKIMAICKDARSVFYNTPAKRNQYRYDTMKHRLFPNDGAGSIHVSVFDAVNMRPVAGATVRTPYFDKSTVTGRNGSADLLQLTEGLYPVTIEMPGYATVVLPSVKVNKGRKTLEKAVYLVRVPSETGEEPEKNTRQAALLLSEKGVGIVSSVPVPTAPATEPAEPVNPVVPASEAAASAAVPAAVDGAL